MADIRKDLYSLEYSSAFNIAGIEEADINVVLTKSTETSATVYGTVTDSTGPVEDATVKVFDKDGVPYKHTLTDSTGSYALDGIEVGTYSVAVAKTGYLMTETKGVTLSDSDNVELDFVMSVESSLSLGAIAGLLYASTAEGTKTELGGAKVSLLESDGDTVSVTYSADDGEFAFYDVEDGTYTVICSSDGYLSSSPMTVTITNGSFSNIEMVLQIDERTYSGTVSGYVKSATGSILSGCFVGLYSVSTDSEGKRKETLVATSKTNTNGLYLFGGVAEGNYIVKAKMSA